LARISISVGTSSRERFRTPASTKKIRGSRAPKTFLWTLINGEKHIGEIKYGTLLTEISKTKAKKAKKPTSKKASTTTRTPGL